MAFFGALRTKRCSEIELSRILALAGLSRQIWPNIFYFCGITHLTHRQILDKQSN
jgi:hypothetical protein